jgi:two-component system response regulator HydG
MNDPILVVDDDLEMCRLIDSGLAPRGHRTVITTSPAEALDLLEREEFGAVVTDVRMKRIDGLALCREVVAKRPGLPVIVITAFGSMETAVAALRAGAYDFLTKPFELDAMRHTVERALEHRALSQKVVRLERALREARSFEDLLGESPPMRRLFELVERVAATDAVVLVTGESGTGKELVARALHRRSTRRSGPFVAVNCAAMPEQLLESELFGHVKGAFTDARADRAGLFLEANGGTLFLDEIGELPVELQPKLLRALEERSVRPVGGRAELPFDVRIVAATNRDLKEAIAAGEFREDLYYRLRVIEIETPPLRVRGNDILLLAQRFLEHFVEVTRKPVTGFQPVVAERLLRHPWPGNVRELRNCVERAVTLARSSEITIDDLPSDVAPARARGFEEPDELVSMAEVERRYVLRVLEASGGNKSLAAKILGFNRKTLYRKLAEYGVEAG